MTNVKIIRLNLVWSLSDLKFDRSLPMLNEMSRDSKRKKILKKYFSPLLRKNNYFIAIQRGNAMRILKTLPDADF